MAHIHSSVGSRTSQRTPVHRTLNHKEKMLFALGDKDQGLTRVSNEKLLHSGSGGEQDNRGSTNSEKSSNNASRESSVTSKTGYRTSMELAPVPNSPFPARTKGTPSTKSSKDPHISPQATDQTIFVGGHDTLQADVRVTSPTDIQRPLSPRRQIELFQATNLSPPRTFHSSPMERFLAYDGGSTDSEGDPHMLVEEWERLRALRVNILRLRGQLRQLRKELHQKEFAKSSADDAFIKHIRHIQSGSTLQVSRNSLYTEDSTLEEHYAAIQEARDEYGPIFDEYNNMEDLLDQQEFEMTRIEGRLYRTSIDEIPHPGPTLVGLSSEIAPDLHPLHISYLSRLGDLDLARERHQNMVQERDSLLYTQESRSRVGMQVHEEQQNFLDQFPAQEAAVLGEIAEIENDVERQRQACLEEGVELAESSFGDNEDSDVEAISSRSPSDHAIIEPSMFSLLLPKSKEKRRELSVFITDFDEGNKSDRINRWLRYQLQTSPLEVELLVRIFCHILQIFDLRRWRECIFHWQVCVTNCWEHDDANRQFEILKTPGTRNSITGSLISTMARFYELSEKTIMISSQPSKPVRRARSAPCLLDLGTMFSKEEFARAQPLSNSH